MTAFYDFFRKLKFSPGSPTNSTTSGVSAIMGGSTITGSQLTVGTLNSGVISVGMSITGGGITVGTYIISNDSGDGSGSVWNLSKSYSTPLGPFTVTGFLGDITEPTELEADSIVDTANIVAGRNISFSVKDTIDPAGLDQYQRFTIDSVTINGPDYQTYVPLGTTKLRLEKNLGDATSDIRVYADPESTITVTRTGTNELKIGHTAPNIPFSQEQIEDMSAQLILNGTHREIDVTYNDLGEMPLTPLGQTTTTGPGTGALFRVSILQNQYNVAIEAPGADYVVGDIITINGNTFPTGTNGFTPYGTTPVTGNDLRIVVTEVHSGEPLYVALKGYTLVEGSIVGYTDDGTPVSPANIDLQVTSTLENVTSRGASSTYDITLSKATQSTNYNTGVLTLTAGGLGVFGNINAKGYIATENQLKSTVAQGTAPLVVTSTTMVSNLQSETASRWHTARTVTFATGDMAGNFTIDGSANVNNVSLTATAPFLAYIETEIAKSVPYGSVGQVPFIATDSTRLTEQDFTVKFGQFIESDAELDAAKLRFESPSTIFSTWTRFSHNTTANQPANAGELDSWTYDSVNDRILSTVNSSTVIGFVSPKTYSNYTHEVRLSSSSSDDDAIGVVIAWYVDPSTGRQNTLSAVRSPGGLGFTWQVIYNFGRSDAVVIADKTANIKWGNGAYGATAGAAGYITNQTLGGWDDFTTVGTKVKVVRNGDSIVVSTTDFNGINYVAAADITIDLVGTAVLNKFRGPKSYGYLALSQDAATFEILGFTDTASAIFDMRTGGMWTYAAGVWTLQNVSTNNIYTNIGPGRFVYDVYNEKLFYTNSDLTLNKLNDHDTLALVTARGATTSVSSTFSGGIVVTGLTVAKSGTESVITFPAQTNDPAYIKHIENNDVSGMYFNVSDNPDDFFHFGYLASPSTFKIRSDGVVTAGTWQGSSISTTYTDAKVTSLAGTAPIAVSASTGAITISHNTSGVAAGTYNSVTVNTLGHVTDGSTVTHTLDSVTTSGATTNNGITVGSVTGKFVDVVANVATISNPLAPNWNSGSVQRFTVNQNFTLNAPTNMPVGGNLTLILTQDGTGNRVMTPAASYKFASNYKVLSTTAGAIDMINIFYDGTVYYAALTTGYA